MPGTSVVVGGLDAWNFHGGWRPTCMELFTVVRGLDAYNFRG